MFKIYFQNSVIILDAVKAVPQGFLIAANCLNRQCHSRFPIFDSGKGWSNRVIKTANAGFVSTSRGIDNCMQLVQFGNAKFIPWPGFCRNLKDLEHEVRWMTAVLERS